MSNLQIILNIIIYMIKLSKVILFNIKKVMPLRVIHFFILPEHIYIKHSRLIHLIFQL